MKSLILALLAVVALVVLVPSVQACNYGDGSVVGGTAFSLTQPVYQQAVQAEVGCVQPQAVVYTQPLVQSVVQAVVGGYGYGNQAIVVRRGLFNDRVIVHRHGNVRVRVH